MDVVTPCRRGQDIEATNWRAAHSRSSNIVPTATWSAIAARVAAQTWRTGCSPFTRRTTTPE